MRHQRVLGFLQRAQHGLFILCQRRIGACTLRGDLRPYALVQFGSLTIVVLTLALYRQRDTGGLWLSTALALYGVAKIFEVTDRPIYQAIGLVSGHTLKHITAAAAVGCVAAMLHTRQAESPNV